MKKVGQIEMNLKERLKALKAGKILVIKHSFWTYFYADTANGIIKSLYRVDYLNSKCHIRADDPLFDESLGCKIEENI